MKYIDLSKFKIGRKQQVGIMSVYPLFADDVETSLAAFEDIKFDGTIEYGTMVFTNKSDYPFIIPTGYSIITKQLAQDHALPFASLLEPNSRKEIEVACCIQKTQCGFIDGKRLKEEFSILPLYIRKQHFKKTIFPNGKIPVAIDNDFSRLWKHISDFQRDLIQNDTANLVLFFNKFMDKLTRFNAEFEVLDGQRGAVILLNDRIVGIEIAPTHAYWKTVWNSLIRDCYGSEIIRLTMQNLVEEFKTSTELDLDLSNCKSVEEIEKAIEVYYEKDKESFENKLREFDSIDDILEIPKHKSIIEDNCYNNISYHIFKAKDKEIYGEVYCDGDKMIYCSVLF